MSQFLLHPENADFVAGRMRYPFSIRDTWFGLGCATVVMLPFVCIVALLQIYSFAALGSHLLFAYDAMHIVGRVIDREQNYDEGVVYTITYAFTANDRTFERRQVVDEALYNTYATTESILIEYAASNPSVSRVDGTSSLLLDLVITGIVSVVGLFMYVFMYGVITMKWKHLKLRQHGQVIPGKIAQIAVKESIDDEFQISLTPAFTPPDNPEEITLERDYSVNHLKRKVLPKPGTPISILYVNPRLWEVL